MILKNANLRALRYVLLCVPLAISACRTTGPRATDTTTTTTGAAPTAQVTSDNQDTPIVSMAPCMEPVVRVDTTLGSFTLTLDAKAAPLTVENFIDYAKSGFYNGLVFHRVVSGMMIQGGAYTPSLERRTYGLRDSIFNEWDNGLRNGRYTIGMVRRPGILDSAQNEFYINLIDHFALDMTDDGAGFCVFGMVTDGLDTIARIKNAPLASHPKYAEGRSAVVPTPPIIIKKMAVMVPLDRDAAKAEAAKQKDIRENRLTKFIEKLEKEAGRKAVKSDTGLIYIDMVIGDGGVPAEDSNVDVYYRGYYINEVEFETQMDKPALLQMPALTPGMREGLLTMREGGMRVLIMPPKLGYGSGGIPGIIAPDSTLVFDVKLIEIR